MSNIFATKPDGRSPRATDLTRRTMLRILVEPVVRAYRAIASGFKSIDGTHLALWFHHCFFGGGLRFAAG